jgi:hypothetical protein
MAQPYYPIGRSAGKPSMWVWLVGISLKITGITNMCTRGAPVSRVER